MYNYFHWSLRQLYLLAFWPSQFEREIETPGTSPPGFAKQCRYLLKMFPWIVALAALGNVVIGQVCQANQVPFEWSASWLGLTVGMAVGLTAGTVAGTGGSVAFAAAGRCSRREVEGAAPAGRDARRTSSPLTSRPCPRPCRCCLCLTRLRPTAPTHSHRRPRLLHRRQPVGRACRTPRSVA